MVKEVTEQPRKMGELKKKKQDLDWMIQLCEPTPSQEEALLHCPFIRESEVFNEPLLMSSLGPTQPDPNHIIMLSVPESALTPDDDDDAVFVTPPENHFHSSSESDQRIRVGVSSQGGIGDEAESNQIRASLEIQPVVETQPIDVGRKNLVVETEVVVLDESNQIRASLETRPVVETQPIDVGIKNLVVETEVVLLDESKKIRASETQSVVETQPIDVGIKNLVVVLDGSDLDNEVLILEDDRVEITRDEEGRSSKGGLGSSKTDKRADKGTESVVGKEKASVDDVNGGSGSKKIADLVVGNLKVNKDGVNGDVGAGTSRNGFDGNNKQGRRKLPESVQGGEKNTEVEKEIDFYDILEMWESTEGDGDGEEVDFVETTKKRGTVFPRPRWWDPDW